MTQLLAQLKQRRLKLGLKQHDMLMRVGVSRQQYQQLESKGNPRLSTLELVSQGLNAQLMLIPTEKLLAVNAILAADEGAAQPNVQPVERNTLADDPWQGLLPDDE